MTGDKFPMHIGIPINHQANIRGAAQMLRDSSVMFRLKKEIVFADLCDAHALRLDLAVRAIEKGEKL